MRDAAELAGLAIDAQRHFIPMSKWSGSEVNGLVLFLTQDISRFFFKKMRNTYVEVGFGFTDVSEGTFIFEMLKNQRKQTSENTNTEV